MASSSKGLRTVIQVVLALVIVALSYVLYRSVTEPYKIVERQREVTRLTRVRMDQVRQAMIRYEIVNERYPSTLDSLVMFVKADSVMRAEADSLFGEDFNADSLIYSPRTGKRFELAVNDTARVNTYLLTDPDTDDQIGTLEPDVTRLNAASWE